MLSFCGFILGGVEKFLQEKNRAAGHIMHTSPRGLVGKEQLIVFIKLGFPIMGTEVTVLDSSFS